MADFLDALVRGDELALGGRVHPVVAGRDGRRAGNAHVDFAGAGGAYHADDLAAGGAADNRIIDEDDALAIEHAAHRIQLELHAEIADALLGLDEGAPDVVAADKADAV